MVGIGNGIGMSFVTNPFRFSVGGGGGASAEYWRVFVTDNNGDGSFVQIGEVEFLDSGGSVVAATGGSTIASNLGSEPSGNEAAKAFDGNADGTSWSSADVTDVFVGYQYPSAQAIAGVRLTNSNSATVAQTARNCSLEYSSDGSMWTEALAFTNPAISSAAVTFNQDWVDDVDGGAHHYWRVYIPTINSGALVVCTELELRTVVSGADQTPVLGSNINNATGRVIFSAQEGGNEAYRAFDGVGGSNGWAVVSAPPEWLGFVFTEPKDIVEIMYQAWSDASKWTPTEIQIQSSDDGDTWSTEATHSSLSFTNSEQKVLSVP